MPLGNFGQLPNGNMSLQELADMVGRLIKEVNYLLNGGLDTLNVNELSADVINAGTLNANLVSVAAQNSGKSFTLDTNGIRANNGIVDTMKFDLATGLLTIVSALIQSATGYPRVELNGQNNVFAAYKASDIYVDINPNLSSNVPGIDFVFGTKSAQIYFFNPGTQELFISTPLNQANIEISSGLDLMLNPQGNLKINGTNGYTGSFTAGTKTVTVNKGIITSVV